MGTFCAITWMKRALIEAQKGGIAVRPNPLVGAVIVKNGILIATGYHKCYGRAHAEVEALKKAGTKAKNATLYVTLEPCDHTGKTPPCTDAIISAGISTVILAMKDPHTRVSGKGIRKLRKAGIKVTTGVLSHEAYTLNRVYIKNITRHEPYVILKMAQTLDGKIASKTGDSKWISNPRSRDLVHTWRTASEAVMVGENTVLHDNPYLTSHGKGRDPVRVIISAGRIKNKSLKIFDKKQETIVISSNTLTLNQGKQQAKRIKLKRVIKDLFKRGIYQILIEGGGTINAYALSDDIVDEVRFFISPKLLGGKDAPTAVEGIGLDRVSQALPVKNWTCVPVGSDFLITGYIHEYFKEN